MFKNLDNGIIFKSWLHSLKSVWPGVLIYKVGKIIVTTLLSYIIMIRINMELLTLSDMYLSMYLTYNKRSGFFF